MHPKLTRKETGNQNSLARNAWVKYFRAGVMLLGSTSLLTDRRLSAQGIGIVPSRVFHPCQVKRLKSVAALHPTAWQEGQVQVEGFGDSLRILFLGIEFGEKPFLARRWLARPAAPPTRTGGATLHPAAKVFVAHRPIPALYGLTHRRPRALSGPWGRAASGHLQHAVQGQPRLRAAWSLLHAH